MRKIFFVCFLTLSSALTSCGSNQESSSSTSSSDSSIDDLYGLNGIEWEEILRQEPEDYYSYIYSPYCYYCNLIKPKINLMANSNEITLFFVVYNERIPIHMEPKNVIGYSDVSELYIAGTPTLFRVEEHKIADVLIGANEIENYINFIFNLN